MFPGIINGTEYFQSRWYCHPAEMRDILAESIQGLLEKRLGEGRVVTANAPIIFHDLVVPHRRCDRFGIHSGDRPTLLVHDAALNKQSMDLVEHRLDLGLHAVDVECGGIGMAARAGRNIRCEGVVAAFPMWQVTQVFSTVVACMLGLPVTAPAPPMPGNMSLCGLLALWHLIRNRHVNENRGCCFTAPIVMHVFYGVYLLERFQGCFEQGLGIGWVVDAHALIIGYEFVVPHCICDRFGNLQGS